MSRQQDSAFSSGSLGVLTPKQDEFCYYEDMTETELQQVLENVIHLNLFLRLENDIFERYLARRHPESLQTIAQILEKAKRIQKIAPQHNLTPSVMSASGSLVNVHDKDSPSVSSVTPSRHVTSLLSARAPNGRTKITYMHRIEMVNTEIRELQKKLEKIEQMSTKKKIYLRARMEENQISTCEIFKNREEFEENVVQKGIDSITGKIPAEKFIRFIEDSLKVVDIITEKIRLKMATIKCQIIKIKLQLKHRKELGETLRVIDFEQLKIKNRICVQKVDEKNQYLLEMKRMAGCYNITFGKHKKKVDGLMLIMNQVRNKIVSKKQEIVKLQSKQIAAKIEIDKEEKQLKSIMELINNFEIPSVIDSIKLRMKLDNLQEIHKRLSRRREIHRITLKSKKITRKNAKF
ncbi:PREDICTED: coiled-coil domain-containing protein 113-like [Trachymyrmex septentrionalis]|uniref:coiled-coil domain-containing protein 113-like n=1 Tax=Trachymyrmex septentrionalis TaxID=34720 RepID=UPI00084F6D69|nr:PREDICTED: coiled-coil domain-containing protein 113-like [Trachymyrmex septentrionalis]